MGFGFVRRWKLDLPDPSRDRDVRARKRLASEIQKFSHQVAGVTRKAARGSVRASGGRVTLPLDEEEEPPSPALAAQRQAFRGVQPEGFTSPGAREQQRIAESFGRGELARRGLFGPFTEEEQREAGKERAREFGKAVGPLSRDERLALVHLENRLRSEGATPQRLVSLMERAGRGEEDALKEARRILEGLPTGAPSIRGPLAEQAQEIRERIGVPTGAPSIGGAPPEPSREERYAVSPERVAAQQLEMAQAIPADIRPGMTVTTIDRPTGRGVPLSPTGRQGVVSSTEGARYDQRTGQADVSDATAVVRFEDGTTERVPATSLRVVSTEGAAPRRGILTAGEAGAIQEPGVEPFKSVIPEEWLDNIERNLGPAGTPVRHTLEWTTSPAALAAAPIIGPAGIAEVLAGEAGAITLGTIARAVGAPEPVSIGAEVVGGFTTFGMAKGLVKLPTENIVQYGQRVRAIRAKAATQGADDVVAQADDILEQPLRQVVETETAQAAPRAVTETPGAAPEVIPAQSPSGRFPARGAGENDFDYTRRLKNEGFVGRSLLEAFEEDAALRRPASRVPAVEPPAATRLPADVGQTAGAPPEDELARIDPDLAAGREPAGMPGVGAATAELPTMRQVEARSAPIPLEDKRAVATEILANTRPDARPLSVGEVAEQWRDRYKSNWFTRLDDVIAPLRGKDRVLEKTVRDTMVTRDIASMQEGYIQAQRVNAWVGRNKDVLGLRFESRIPGGPGITYARGVQPKPGAKIPKRALQRLKDIREHPEDYIIAPEQQRALDEAGDLFEQMKLSNWQHGVDFEPVDRARYWPGIVTNAPKGSSIPVFRGGGELAATPGWAKTRQVPTLREGLAAGADYADDIEAMTIRLTGGAEANANRWAVEQVQRLGQKPSERVSARLSEHLKATQQAYKEARLDAQKAATALTKHGGTDDLLVAERLRREAGATRQAAIEAEVALDQAKAAMRAEANRVNTLRPRAFGRVVAPDVAEELSRYVGTEDAGVVQDVFQLWRGSMVTGDHSSLFNQNMMLFWRNNPAWMKAAGLSSLAFKEAPYAWAARNAPDIEQAIRLGFATPPTEFLLRQGGGISQFFDKLPVVRQSQRAFEWNIFIGQVERYKAAKTLGLSTDELLDMSAVTRKQAGTLFMPGKTKAQAKALSLGFFAPQYTGAFVSALYDPVLATGAAQREALKSLGLMFGGAASATIGLSMLINGEMPNMDDPDKAGYWGIRVGGGFVYPLGPFQPLVKALHQTAKGDRKALPRFLEGKASVPARVLLRAAEAMGAPLEDIRGPSFSDPTKTFGERGLGPSFADIAPGPIGLTEVVEGVRAGAPVAGLEPLGLRTTAETASQEFKRLYEDKYGVAPDSDVSPRTLDDDLAEQAGYGPASETEFGKAETEALGEETGFLADAARIALRGNPEAMDTFDKELGDYFRVKSGVDTTLRQQFDFSERASGLVNEWYALDPRARRDPETAQPDWDYYYSERQRILRALRRGDRSDQLAADALEKGKDQQFPDPDLQRAYEALRTLEQGIDAYYDIESDERESYRERHARLDAQLYLLGRVSTLKSAEAERLVTRLGRELLGTTVELPERGRRSREPRERATRGPEFAGPMIRVA